MDDMAELVDVELTSTSTRLSRRRLGAVIGGCALVAVLVGGAYVATSDGDSQVDIAADLNDTKNDIEPSDDVDSTIEDHANDADLPVAPDEPVQVVGDDGEAMSDSESAADSAYYGGDSDNVLFDGTKYISIGYDESGQTLRTSLDGIEWDERAFPGLPEHANVYRLAEHGGVVVALVEQWQDFVGEDGSMVEFFGPSEGPTHFLASSSDLATWTYTEIPEDDQSDQGAYRNITGLALGESGVVMFLQSQPQGENELRLLFDAGVLDTTSIERYCGLVFNQAGDIDVQLCTFDEDERVWLEFEEAINAAESDEERAAIERNFDDTYVEPIPEIVATITSADPLYERLSSIYNGNPELPENTVLSGPVTGPWAVTSLPMSGYPSSLIALDDSFVGMLQRWDESFTDGRATTVVIRSMNGADWAQVGTLPAGGFERLMVAGSNLVALGSGQNNQLSSFISTDLGASWSPGALTTQLFGGYPQATYGPAGIAVVLRGSTMPMPEYSSPPDQIISRDGFTLTMTFSNEESHVTLVGPSGDEIYSLNSAELYGEAAERIVRIGRFSGTQTFLDPVTGEDLVSFTGKDFEEYYSEGEPGNPASDYVEGVEIAFSTDGQTWAPITDSRLDVDLQRGDVRVIAVGDDEIIMAVSTWTEPPAELLAFDAEQRNPTEAEEHALNEWFEAHDGGSATEYLSIAVR